MRKIQVHWFGGRVCVRETVVCEVRGWWAERGWSQARSIPVSRMTPAVAATALEEAISCFRINNNKKRKIIIINK